jgi:single-strand DNA-binding protein
MPIASMNHALVSARLIRDPELKYTPTGKAVVTTKVMIDNYYESQEGVEKKAVCFIDIRLWGGRAEAFCKLCVKGDEVLVCGKIEQDQWQGTNGKKHYMTVITASEWRPVGAQWQRRASDGAIAPADIAPSQVESVVEDPGGMISEW